MKEPLAEQAFCSPEGQGESEENSEILKTISYYTYRCIVFSLFFLCLGRKGYLISYLPPFAQ